MLFTNLVLLAILLVSLAFLTLLGPSGLWTNTLTLVNVITAALLATNYFEPLADWLDRQNSQPTYAYDFLSLWLIFAVSFTLLRMATDFMSPVKVEFHKLVDRIGGGIMALWASWVLVCFIAMTLHTAPLSRHFLRGSFQPRPESEMLFGLAPDRKWLAWVHRQSQGSMSRIHGNVPFDARGDFVLRYGNRRSQFESQKTFMAPKGAASTNPLLQGQ